MDKEYYEFCKEFVLRVKQLSPGAYRSINLKYTIEYYDSVRDVDSNKNKLFESIKYFGLSFVISKWWKSLFQKPNPLRVSHSSGNIQIFRNAIKNSSREYMLFLLFWAYYKYNNGAVADDITADHNALNKLLQTEKINKKQFLNEYMSLIKHSPTKRGNILLFINNSNGSK